MQRGVLYSAGCKYAIKAAVFLARQPRGAAVNRIAEECGLPREFLAAVLQRLVRRGILNSCKGRYGGFALNRDPAEIRLWDLVEAIDDENCCCRCVLGYAQCSTAAPCPLHDSWQDLRTHIRSYLEQTTIDQVARMHKVRRKNPG